MVLALLALAPASAVAGEPNNTLLLTVAAPAAEAERFEAVTRELLARLQMRVELRRVERIDVREVREGLGAVPGYFARVWIELPPASRARLYLEHGESDRVLVREVGGDASNPELVREELGHILQTAVEGLKAGEQVGAPRQDALKDMAAEKTAEKPAAEPKAAPSLAPQGRNSPGRVELGARYELSWLGDGRFEDGPGAALALSRTIGVELSAYYRRPLQVTGNPVGVRLQTVSLRGLLTIPIWSAARGSVRLGAGGGADLVRVRSIASSELDAELANPSGRKLALGRVQGTYAYRAASFIALTATVGLDLDFNGTRYVFQRAAGELRVLDPSPLRPFFSLGATVP